MCKNVKVRTHKGKKYFYCSIHKKIINKDDCCNCKDKEYKQYKKMKQVKIQIRSGKVSKRSKACDISQRVKEAVFKRDNGRCVICGNHVNVMPNAHYISRQDGGLGIEENVFTACTRLTENDCHYKYDNGTEEEKETCREKIEANFKRHYSNWNPKNLVYKK